MVSGDEARELRKASGMSQAEFGAAMGISRETISRIERSNEPIDRRTELAMRYVAENLPRQMKSPSEIFDNVISLLDQAAVRGQPGFEHLSDIRSASAAWTDSGWSSEGAELIQKAQSALGMLSVSPSGDPLHSKAMQDILTLKRRMIDWRLKQ